MARPISKLTPEITEPILQHLRNGNFRVVAVGMVGLSQHTFRDWLKKGKKDPDSEYGAFLAKVIAAEREAERKMVDVVFSGADKDPRHAEWYLERKFPKRWGRKLSAEVTGKDGEPLTIEIRKVTD